MRRGRSLIALLALATLVATPVLEVAAATAATSAQASGGGGDAPPPWRAGEDVRTALFEAQTDILLGDGRGAGADVDRARRALRGDLTAALRRVAPDQLLRAREGLTAAERAAGAADEPRLAAARGQVWSALLAGGFAAARDAAARGDAAEARSWLLLREFRRATRFTRPGSDATEAIDDLAAREGSARAARLAVDKDLLDAYQGRLGQVREDARDAIRKGFRTRLAEAGALADGYWRILAQAYRAQRGAKAEATAAAAFTALARAAADGDVRAYTAADRAVARALDGFTAAPFTAEEQARLAQQLIRFLDLIPKEYRDGVDGDEVTVPFEIQEGIAFQEAALAAFNDLRPVLDKRDPARSAAVTRGLTELGTYVNDAAEGGEVVSEDTVKQAQERTHAELDALLPGEWKKPTDEADFDLIELTLDRMEAAAGAGEYSQAEQARLEAYAFFEFGPELRLTPFDPELVADIEGLVWFGARDQPGLAKLIGEEKGAREIRQTRLALDEALEDAQATLGDSQEPVTIVTNSAIIVFREGLEAVLILAAVTASFVGANRRRRRPVMVGAVLALVATGATFVLAQTVLSSLSEYGEKLEAVVGLVAIAVLLLVLNWFFHKVYWTKYIAAHHKRRKKLLKAASGGILSAQAIGLVLLGFTTVYREGFETVLFLQALELSAGPLIVLQGVALGLGGVAIIAALMFAIQKRLPYKKMLIVTGVLIGLVLVMMVGNTARTLQGVGWLSITPIDIDLPYWMGVWFGVYPTVETMAAQVAAGVFVIGSYFVAERMRKPGRKKTSGEADPGAGDAGKPAGDEQPVRREPARA